MLIQSRGSHFWECGVQNRRGFWRGSRPDLPKGMWKRAHLAATRVLAVPSSEDTVLTWPRTVALGAVHSTPVAGLSHLRPLRLWPARGLLLLLSFGVGRVGLRG